MGALEHFLGGLAPPDPARRQRVGLAVQRAEDDVAIHEVQTWAALEKLKLDVRACGEASSAALDEDIRIYTEGLTKADGDPARQELVLRYVQLQNEISLRHIRDVMG